jgi:membrane carboxypeptidase/penicillin-binding protein PbpC
VRTALGASLNVPAVRVAAMLPPDALHARLNALGLDLKRKRRLVRRRRWRWAAPT